MRFDKQASEEIYTKTLANAPQGLGVTRTNLQRLLRSLDFVGWSTNEESGRLNRRALVKFATGSANIFSRREYVEAETSAVSILIDCSGSMNAVKNDVSRIQVAQQVAVHLSKILQQARVPFSVTGFHSSYGTSRMVQGREVQRPVFIPFKTWRKSLQQSTAALGAIGSCATGGTPDYSALYNALDDLSRREEKRKILFVLTDADGYQPEHMKHLQSLADRVGITIVAIGIMSREVVECFVNSASVNDLSGLAGASFNQLLKAVRVQ
jgi:cobalamin biosynthesis protein CobT